ncbi:secreted protein [Beggiatoa sp. PS]|nr:secreted protein [Beggiatoa sp. PS]
MKPILIYALVIVVQLLTANPLFAWSLFGDETKPEIIPEPKSDPEPEYDGLYVKTKSGEYIEIKKRSTATNFLGDMLFCSNNTNETLPKFDINNIDGIYVRGPYNFSNLFVQKPVEKQIYKELIRYCAPKYSEIATKQKYNPQDNSMLIRLSQHYGTKVSVMVDGYLWVFEIEGTDRELFLRDLYDRDEK